MERGDGVRCPGCEGRLGALAGTSLPLSGCTACGGVWLGPDAAVHVMRGLGDQLDTELARASANAGRVSKVPSRDSGMRSCPACSVAMGRIVIGEVIVDTCSAHGTWFDRGEIEGVVAACAKLRKRQEREDGNDITAEGLAQGVGLVVTGTASVAWGALVNVFEYLVTPRRNDEYDDRGRWE